MTLFQQLKDIVPMGYIVTFGNEPFNLKISVERTIGEQYFCKENWLPTADHFYESKVVDCINFMVEEIQKEND